MFKWFHGAKVGSSFRGEKHLFSTCKKIFQFAYAPLLIKGELVFAGTLINAIPIIHVLQPPVKLNLDNVLIDVQRLQVENNRRHYVAIQQSSLPPFLHHQRIREHLIADHSLPQLP